VRHGISEMKKSIYKLWVGIILIVLGVHILIYQTIGAPFYSPGFLIHTREYSPYIGWPAIIMGLYYVYLSVKSD
jgi:hypothetical protein